MGFDVTIKRADGRPLGYIADVQQALVAVFPGIVLGQSLSGAEKLRRASEQGVTFPEILRQHVAASVPEYEGDYEGPEFSAQFHLGPSETVREIDVVLYGNMEVAEATFAQLTERYEWITTHP